jgi:hypothetical protein
LASVRQARQARLTALVSPGGGSALLFSPERPNFGAADTDTDADAGPVDAGLVALVTGLVQEVAANEGGGSVQLPPAVVRRYVRAFVGDLADPPTARCLARTLVTDTRALDALVVAVEELLAAPLPDLVVSGHDLPGLLAKGVLLCRVVQRTHPAAMAALPGGDMPLDAPVSNLKARKYIEAFLAACRAAGVAAPNAMDILQEKATPQLIGAVQELIKKRAK